MFAPHLSKHSALVYSPGEEEGVACRGGWFPLISGLSSVKQKCFKFWEQVMWDGFAFGGAPLIYDVCMCWIWVCVLPLGLWDFGP